MSRFFFVLMAFVLTACQPSSTQFLNSNITSSQLSTKVPLQSHDGQTLELNAPNPNQVTAVFFGYTSCPDICPTTMGVLKLVKQQLGSDAAKLRVVFVSLDPARDSAVVLKQYAQAFGDGFVGASADVAHTPILTQDLGVAFEKVGDGAVYTLNHTANLFLVDALGRFRVSVPYGAPPASIVHDVQQLLHEQPKA